MASKHRHRWRLLMQIVLWVRTCEVVVNELKACRCGRFRYEPASESREGA